MEQKKMQSKIAASVAADASGRSGEFLQHFEFHGGDSNPTKWWQLEHIKAQ
jgi:hypothetical protein